MSKLSKYDQEDDKAGNPAIFLIVMHHLVPKQRNQECRSCNHDNARPAWHIMVDSVEELSADDCVDCRPADACQYVQACNDFDGVVTEEEA